MVRFARSYCNLNTAGQELRQLIAQAEAGDRPEVDRPQPGPAHRARRLSDGEKAELARDYVGGMTEGALATKFDTRRQTIAEHLRRMGVPIRKPGLSDEQVDQAAELYGEGLTLKQVGMKLGADAGTVRLALLRRG